MGDSPMVLQYSCKQSVVLDRHQHEAKRSSILNVKGALRFLLISTEYRRSVLGTALMGGAPMPLCAEYSTHGQDAQDAHATLGAEYSTRRQDAGATWCVQLNMREPLGPLPSGVNGRCQV